MLVQPEVVLQHFNDYMVIGWKEKFTDLHLEKLNHLFIILISSPATVVVNGDHKNCVSGLKYTKNVFFFVPCLKSYASIIIDLVIPYMSIESGYSILGFWLDHITSLRQPIIDFESSFLKMLNN